MKHRKDKRHDQPFTYQDNCCEIITYTKHHYFTQHTKMQSLHTRINTSNNNQYIIHICVGLCIHTHRDLLKPKNGVLKTVE